MFEEVGLHFLSKSVGASVSLFVVLVDNNIIRSGLYYIYWWVRCLSGEIIELLLFRSSIPVK